MASPGGVEVSRASVRFVPDTSHLFADLKADLERIERDLSLNVKASVDATELTASAREAVAQAQTLAGNIDIKANIDTSQVGEIEQVFKRASSGATGLLSNFSVLGAGAGILSTALIPLVAVLAGLAAALAAPLAIVAGGVTIFGFLAGFAVKDVTTQMKKIAALQTKLDGLQKGTSDYADTLKQLRDAQSALTPAQSMFAKAIGKVKVAFDQLPKGVILKPLTDALSLLAKVIPDLTPIVRAVSGVFDGLVGSLDRVVSSPGFKKFVKAFAQDLGRDLKSFATIAGNIALGLGGLFSVLDDTLSKGVLKGLENISKKFADFGRTAGQNKGLKSFVDYVKQNMPNAGRLISGVLSLLGDVFTTLAPVGSAVLSAVTGIVGQFQKLGDLAGPLAGTLAAFGIGSFFGGPEVGAAVAGVVGLVGAFEQLYKKSKPLQSVIHDMGDYFTKTWLPKIQDAARDVMPALKDSFKDISGTIRNNKGLFEVFGKAIVAIGSQEVIFALQEVAFLIRGIGKAFKYGTEAVKLWANVTIAEFQFIILGVKAVTDGILNSFGRVLDVLANTIGRLPNSLTHGLSGMVNAADKNFHKFTDSTNGTLDKISQNLANLQRQINEIGKPNPKFHIDSNTLNEIKLMHELQALQISDKHFKITALIEQQIERTTGPGGGMQRPTGLNGGGGGSGGGSSRSGAQVNVEKMYTTDTNDILRKSGARARSRAGGGVSFPPALVPNFAGTR